MYSNYLNSTTIHVVVAYTHKRYYFIEFAAHETIA